MITKVKKMLCKEGFGFTEIVIIFSIVAVLIVVATPNVMGAVSDERSINDQKSARAIELSLAKSIEKGQIKLNNDLVAEKVKAVVKAEIGQIPECQRLGNQFFVDKITGRVTAKTMNDSSSEISLN